MKNTSIFISYYNSYPITSGSSAVTTSLFNSWPNKKKLFLMNHEKDINKKNIHNFKILSNNSIIKIISLFPYLLFIYFKIRNIKVKYIIFEGASWTGLVYLSYIFFKILKPNLKCIYHSHNVDFFFRKKNFLLSKLSFYFEKKILKKFYLSTAVSDKDYKMFKSLFKVKTKILPNGIIINNRYLKRNSLKKNYIIFSGSLEYSQNRKIFNKLLKYEFQILKKYLPNIKIFLTGGGKFKFYKNYSYIEELGTLPLRKYMNILINSMGVIVPGSSVTGTKIKIIEALCYNKIVFSNHKSLKGIRNQYNKYIEYKNLNDFEKKIKFLNDKNYNSKIFNQIGQFYRDNYDMKKIVKKFYAENKL